MALRNYRQKRDFGVTPEPRPRVGARRAATAPIFVIQKHAASHLHYDLRLEADGVLKSWAVPKEPAMDPSVKRLAVLVEDHPLEYAKFAGDIPKGEYGAGHVEIWDSGIYEAKGDVSEGVKEGRVEFTLHGKRLKGPFVLVRLAPGTSRGDNWLLIKRKAVLRFPADRRRKAQKP
ncbi:MAG: DNA polymerase ligase N-terminal domain-containing protein [Bdellovibrionota bacterium]